MDTRGLSLSSLLTGRLNTFAGKCGVAGKRTYEQGVSVALNPWRRLGVSEAVAQTARLCEADGGGDANRGREPQTRRLFAETWIGGRRQEGTRAKRTSVARDCAPRGRVCREGRVRPVSQKPDIQRRAEVVTRLPRC